MKGDDKAPAEGDFGGGFFSVIGGASGAWGDAAPKAPGSVWAGAYA